MLLQGDNNCGMICAAKAREIFNFPYINKKEDAQKDLVFFLP